MEYRINNEDVNKWSKEYEGEKFHALLCDAPYHLTTITKRFGKEGAAPAKFGTDGLFQRTSKGFMGQEWDGGDVAFRSETWAGLGKHLLPGAFGMTFGGSRTAHRIAVAIEDAGFIIHPMIGWVYASGFPKATRVKGQPEFDGHRYGLQALKPALEPIIVFQKPFEGRPLDNIVETGVGTINVDGGRIPLNGETPYQINRFTEGAKPFGDAVGEEYETVEEAKGRWPANFIIDDTVAGSLDNISGVSKSVKSQRGKVEVFKKENSWIGDSTERGFSDEGGASRFFFNVDTKLDEADPFIYEKKVSVKEREAGLSGEPTGTNRIYGPKDDYDKKHLERLNPHPTLKSISLTRYLATLLLPPTEYSPRRLLVPFSGVASEMIGAGLAGWDYIEGIELTSEYVPIAHKRIEYWMKER